MRNIKGMTNADVKAMNRKKIAEYLINHAEGVTTKEICVDCGLTAAGVRNHLKAMLNEGCAAIKGTEGSAIVYIYLAPGDKEKLEEKGETIVQETPEHIGGREFEEVRPAHNVDQGDIVWCSSRSGDGQFFRYLVLAPWKRKATVLGIFPQGHPALNLNDARFVDLGTDPETGEELYADISNTCSRGYAQFGEKLMKVSAENMSELKSVMSMYYRMAVKAEVVTGFDDIWKKRFEDLSTKLKASMNSASINGAKVAELTEANDDLKAKLKAAYLECDEKKQAWEEMNTVAKNAMDRISELDAENKRLYGLNKALEEAAAQHVESDVMFTEDTKETIDSLLWKISLLEQELKDKNEMITVLKQITFKSLKVGE